MLRSVLMRRGIGYLATLEKEIDCEDPSAFERAQYMRAITTREVA